MNIKTMTGKLNAAASAVIGASLLSLALVGCSGVVDPNVADRPAVTDVQPYYALLADTNAHYSYSTVYNGQTDKLDMNMEGKAAYNPTSMDAYYCEWKYTNWQTDWYYGLTKDSAVDLGQSYDEQWVDLKQPLALNNSWSFRRPKGDVITARVTKFGAQVALNGRTFDDVIEVTYSGAQTNSVKWFAKGIGLIMEHTVDHNNTLDVRFQAMQQ